MAGVNDVVPGYVSSGPLMPQLPAILKGARDVESDAFVGAMALISYWLRIPTRVAFGFAGGEPTATGRNFRLADGATWLEVWLDGLGWGVVPKTVHPVQVGPVAWFGTPISTPPVPRTQAHGPALAGTLLVAAIAICVAPRRRLL